MTAQSAEILILNDRPEELCCLPLSAYLERRDVDFQRLTGVWSSSLQRGYRGLWEILDGKLYIIGLLDGRDNPIDTAPLFGDQVFPIHAHWFSGRLMVDQGDELTYMHMGWGGSRAQSLYIYVEQGRVRAQRRYDQVKRLRRHYFKNFEENEALRQHMASNIGPFPRPLAGFTQAGLQALGLAQLEGESQWPDGLTEADFIEWTAPLLMHCRRPGPVLSGQSFRP